MDARSVVLIKEHLQVEPHKRKPANQAFITHFLSSLDFFKGMLGSIDFSNGPQYIDIISYYLKYGEYKQGEILTEKFEEHSLVYVLTGNLRRVEYERDPDMIKKLFEEKLNYHRDKMYWKKDLVLLWTQQVRLLGPGDVHLMESRKQTRLLVESASCQILYITAQKLRDAEILRTKSMRNETNFLKNTLFWKKLDIEQLKQIVIRCSHELYDSRQYVYREGDPIKCVYVVREGEFLYEKSVTSEEFEHSKPKTVRVSKLEQGEVIGYNEILDGSQVRQHSLRCCSEAGELYLLPMDYWEELYQKFLNQFNQLHRKCSNFREKEMHKRVKSIQQCPESPRGRGRRLNSEPPVDLLTLSRRKAVSQEARELSNNSILPLLSEKEHNLSIIKPRKPKNRNNPFATTLFLTPKPKNPTINNYPSIRPAEPQLTSYNSMHIQKCKQQRMEHYRLKINKQNMGRSLELYKMKSRRAEFLEKQMREKVNRILGVKTHRRQPTFV